jgi:hypothetical protein
MFAHGLHRRRLPRITAQHATLAEKRFSAFSARQRTTITRRGVNDTVPGNQPGTLEASITTAAAMIPRRVAKSPPR